MTVAAVRLAVELARALPAADVRLLALALRRGTAAVHGLQAESAGTPVREACRRLLAADLSDDDRHLAAGALLGASEPDSRVSHLDVVWTGPASGVTTSRLTSAVVVDLIDQARTEVLLVGYAVHTEPSVAVALQAAAGRGVALTLLLERHADNPAFSGLGTAFPGMAASRLGWPASVRPAGAALHAKVLVVDEAAALVGSANITGAALERNLECGLLVRGGPAPGALRAHVRGLLDRGVLVRLP